MAIHDGHRDRLKKRYLEQGLDGFNELNTLELLLFFAIPRQDTNVLAHRLLERFGSLETVFEASVPDLMSVDGIGENAAVLISLIPQLNKRCAVAATRNLKWIHNSADAGDYLLPRLMHEKEEKVLLICLDSCDKILSTTELGSGVVNEVGFNIRKLVETALKNRASAVILAHNHPNGFAVPSYEDMLATKQIVAALKLVNIPLLDHIVVSGEDFVSFADSKYL